MKNLQNIKTRLNTRKKRKSRYKNEPSSRRYSLIR